MKVFVKVNYSDKFPIEVGLMDTVFNIKETIGMHLGYSVSEHLLLFNGKLLTEEHLNAQQCKIHDKSVVEILFNLRLEPLPYKAQVLLEYQKQQSSQVKPIQDSRERIFNYQDSTMRNDDQVVHQTEAFPRFLGTQDRSVMESCSNYDQVVPRTEQFQASSNLINEVLDQGWSLMASRSNDGQVFHQTEESLKWPKLKSVQEFHEFLDLPLETSENSSIQDLPLETSENSSIQDLPDEMFVTKQSPIPLNSSGDVWFDKDWDLKDDDFMDIQSYSSEITEEINPMFQTKQSPVPSNAGKEIINIPDSPVRRSNYRPQQKIRVMIWPFFRHRDENQPERKFPVYVNASENVKELRKELVKIQGLKLPEDGYFFISQRGDLVHDDQSFLCNGIRDGDTLEIFQGQVIKDPRPHWWR
ncbi:hypothetical protein AALP_AA6G040000 [Arabis alpina]|uniref:Ubiquitin-like domain-containing protein n=1 Tax=Arabis alpina TaxID=50452 RepID=A0A087GLZ4_ARAAL|nr:hypothetical protein AALP_AA6G040000 [Arabis alpina]